MTRPAMKDGAAISPSLIRAVTERLAEGKRVRRVLTGKGRLHIDRQLPFLCVYRRPCDQPDEGTARLVLGQASYLIASADEGQEADLNELVHGIVSTLGHVFGSFLLVEIWSGRETNDQLKDDGPAKEPPAFRVHTPMKPGPPTTVAVLGDALREIALPGMTPDVEVHNGSIASPPHFSSLLTTNQAEDLGCLMIGLEIMPFYRDAASGDTFPAVLHKFQRELSRTLHKAFFEFMAVQTAQCPPRHQMLGMRAMVKAVWETDRQLAEISDAFDFLLSVTPVNAHAAWVEFRKCKFGQIPEFDYPLLAVDPDLLKRKLFNIPLERIEDPTIAHLFRDKRSELDRQITMLDDRDTFRFLHGSLQVYGAVNEELWKTALEILTELPGGCPADDGDEAGDQGADELLSAPAIARRARAEIGYYRQIHPAMTADVHIRRDVSGLMASRGDLLIGQRTKLKASRLVALLQHEVGTHLLTYFNGRSQPLRQLYTGLAGYEELQEGLAVLSEYMVDGLSPLRLRVLAARVVAVRHLTSGASFLDIFRELHHSHGFAPEKAFQITTRVVRSGGLTKDAVYLRGLVGILDYLRGGGTWEPLFVGKIGAEHIKIIRELLWREVIHKGPLLPRYMGDARIAVKMEKLRGDIRLLDLVNT